MSNQVLKMANINKNKNLMIELNDRSVSNSIPNQLIIEPIIY